MRSVLLHSVEPSKYLSSCRKEGRNGPLRHISDWHNRTLRLAFCVLLSLACFAQERPVRRILILNEVGTSYPVTNLVDQGVRAALDNSPFRIEFYREYMDTVLFPDPNDQARFRDFYLRKYQHRKLDLIITVGSSPLNFMVETHQQNFPNVPTVFCITNQLSGTFRFASDFTGVEGDVAPAETLSAALLLMPRTKHVVVVGGTAPYDRQQQAAAKEQLKHYEESLEISYLTDLEMSSLLEQLKHLPSQTIVLLTALGRDAKGISFNSSQVGPLVVGAANAPVFSLSDRFLNHGEVGGKLSSAVEQGRVVGNMALRILKGEKPSDIPSLTSATIYTFDWRALNRWNLKEARLPPGSIVLNRPLGLWELYKWYIVAGAFLFVAETLLLFALMWQRARRRKAEARLTVTLAAARESEMRFRLVANTAPVMIWMSGTDKLCNYFNQPWLEFTGRTFEMELGNGWADSVHRDDLTVCLNTYSTAFDRQQPFSMQYRLRRHDGNYRWVFNAGVPRFNSDGSFAGFIGSCIDITERKQAEEALRDINRKLIQAQEEERTRIGRELHDDICARLALIVVSLTTLAKEISSSEVELIHQRVEAACAQVLDLEKDIQALSHRLHSSRLEYLGLVAAASGFCRELSGLHNVEIKFRSDGISEPLPNEVSLCLFRVLQEALHNAAKHSGARQIEVLLTGTETEIRLAVHDFGVGFHSDEAGSGHGLGLVSMRERLRLIEGQLVVDSKPHQGTTVIASVPWQRAGTPAGKQPNSGRLSSITPLPTYLKATHSQK